jgi:uncharacterized surface protein with fasciclin (FAS1) repeats
MRTLARWFLTASTAFALSACGGSDDHPGNVVDTARANGNFGVLLEAATAAGLADTLATTPNLTVFAPTDAAFTALLTELGLTKAQLLGDTALLKAVLQYHVLNTQVASSAIAPGKAVVPLAGGFFKIDKTGSAFTITDGRNRTAGITAADVAASNGVIHAIDKVLLPADKTVVATAQALAAANPGEFKILVEAVVAANLAGTLSGTGPFTVFAPTDAAFAALLTELGLTKAQLLADTALLTKVLTYHVVGARVLKAEVPVGAAVTTVQGGTLTVDASLKITDQRGRQASITGTDVLASNGVIHVIGKVILPAP